MKGNLHEAVQSERTKGERSRWKDSWIVCGVSNMPRTTRKHCGISGVATSGKMEDWRVVWCGFPMQELDVMYGPSCWSTSLSLAGARRKRNLQHIITNDYQTGKRTSAETREHTSCSEAKVANCHRGFCTSGSQVSLRSVQIYCLQKIAPNTFFKKESSEKCISETEEFDVSYLLTCATVVSESCLSVSLQQFFSGCSPARSRLLFQL